MTTATSLDDLLMSLEQTAADGDTFRIGLVPNDSGSGLPELYAAEPIDHPRTIASVFMVIRVYSDGIAYYGAGVSKKINQGD